MFASKFGICLNHANGTFGILIMHYYKEVAYTYKKKRCYVESETDVNTHYKQLISPLYCYSAFIKSYLTVQKQFLLTVISFLHFNWNCSDAST